MSIASTSPIHVLAATVVACFALAGCGAEPIDEEDVGEAEEALSSDACPDDVPAILTPAPDQRLKFMLHAEGVQIYSCVATTTGFAWTFVAPEAELLKDNGHVVGIHYVGPTWEFKDGSTVVGVKQTAATPDPSAIPWLLLTAVSHTGEGKMTDVTSIQRLSTAGGLAPATGCDAASVGAEADVPYTADYFFYKTGKGKHPPQCGG